MAERTINRPPAGGPPQPGRPATTVQGRAFLDGLVSEMRRVTWPSQPEWVSATVLTVALVVTVSLYTFLLDKGFAFLFGLVHK